MAHCVNLSSQEVACNVKSVKEALSFGYTQQIKYSPKQQVILEMVKHEFLSMTRIKMVTATKKDCSPAHPSTPFTSVK